MNRITVCLDCPLYQTGGWCRHKRKDVGALQPACDDIANYMEDLEEL